MISSGRNLVAFISLLILLPLMSTASVTPTKTCSTEEFWSWDNGCCLPYGGPTSTPLPPSDDVTCPPRTHYWGKKQGCCVPRFPDYDDVSGGPQPQCNKYWIWNATVRKCERDLTPSQPSQPQPSSYSHSNGGSNWKRSSTKARSTPLCPVGLEACPIPGAQGGDIECLDTYTELESCGGCPSLGRGQDCTAIPGAWNVGCERGSCTVYSCAGGYERSANGASCIPL